MLTLRNLRVLLVEDDPEMARTLERVLARYGHRTTLVRSAAEADALGQVHDCGLFDIDLPDGSGVELAERLLDRGELTTVVFFSACTDAEVLEHASRIGSFVSKASGTRALEVALAAAASRAAQQLASGAPNTPPRPRGGGRSGSGTRRKAKP
jgi:DNA-binding response OmpR family regulator